MSLRSATDSAVAHTLQTIESFSAWRTLGRLRIEPTSPHGARLMRPTNGNAKKMIASTASVNAGHGNDRSILRSVLVAIGHGS